MELSDLAVFNQELLTVDDRTGILYRVCFMSVIQSWILCFHFQIVEHKKVVPKVFLVDGPGNVSKPLKGEWMTIKVVFSHFFAQ